MLEQLNNKTSKKTLGIKNPLLPPAPLSTAGYGKIPLAAEVYRPQSAQSLAVLFSPSELPLDSSEQNLPNSEATPPIFTPQTQQEITDNQLEKTLSPLLPTTKENLALIPPKTTLPAANSHRLPITLEVFAEPKQFLPIALEYPDSNSSLIKKNTQQFFSLNSQGITYSEPEKSFPELMIAGEAEEIIFTPGGFQRQEKKQPPPTPQHIPTEPVTIQATNLANATPTANQQHQDLEIIADKVYKILKKRLQIDAERAGGYRSGRFW